METISVRIPTELIDAVDQIARESGGDRQDIIRDCIRAGIEIWNRNQSNAQTNR